MDKSEVTKVLALLAAALPLVVVWVMFWRVLGTWFRSLVSGAGVPFSTLVSLRLKGANLEEIVNACVMLTKGELDIPVSKLVEHQRNGGNVVNLAKGLVGCHIGKIDRSFEELASMDREGVDLHSFVAEQLGARVQE